jgi:hypothetical protein
MKTYKDVAIKHNLTANQARRFVAYMLARWAREEETQCLTGYAGEWAERFKSGQEYVRSDSVGQAVLDMMD